MSALAKAWRATQPDRERWAMRWRKGPGFTPLFTAGGAGLIAYGVWTVVPWLGICLAGVGLWLMEWRLNG